MSDRDRKISNSSSHLWPVVRLGLAAEIATLTAELLQTEWLSPEALEAQQMEQFNILLRFAVDHSTYYAARFSAAGASLEDYPSIESLAVLPLIARQDIQGAGEDFFCRAVPSDQGETGKTQTSGSTGEPVIVRKTGISQLFWHAHTLRNHAWHQLPFSARYTSIRANVTEFQEHANWGAPLVFLYETGPSQLIPIMTPLDRQNELLEDFQPETLLIYPSNLKGLVELWREGSFGLTALTCIKTIGETLTDELRSAVADLDERIALIDGYSSQECGAIALQCPQGSGYHVMSESVIVEILDSDDKPCAPGEIGRVVVTDLHNLASPIIRYDIGDYAQVGESCSCGRGLQKLDRILGRRRNLIVKPNGDRHWPTLIEFHEFAALAKIRQYQMVQETLERISVRIVTDEPLTDEQRTTITRRVQQALGYDFDINILDQRDDLPRLPNGKFEEFMSKIA